MKNCHRCGNLRAEKDYYLRKDTGRRENTCKECRVQIKKDWYVNNVDKQRDQQYKRQYGITLQDYERLFESQEGRCAICRNRPRKRRLAVDHNHKTGEVRGLLCDWCNRKLMNGCKESIQILEQAAQYLRTPPARQVLDTTPSSEA